MTIPIADDSALETTEDTALETPFPENGEDVGEISTDTRSYSHSAARKDENEIFYDLSSVHPLADFDEIAFIDLLEYSLSLSVSEKRRVVDSIPTLSQFQIDELIKVFIDEREEFRKLLAKEGDVIKDLAIKAKEGWGQLRVIYEDEQREFERQHADQAKIDELKNLLDSED